MLRLAAAAVLLSSLAGCDLYWEDDPPQPCAYYLTPAQDHRNPETGVCEPNYGGGGGCGYEDDGYCGPCPAAASDSISQQWPTCYGACSNLDEYSCLAEPGCHAAYNANARADAGPAFMACWDIAPLPVAQGYCEGLDAYSCAMHDDCAGYFEVEYGPDDSMSGSRFSFCGSEQPTAGCLATTCAPGTHCEEQCYGDCGTGTGDPMTGACPAESMSCYPMCVPDNTYSCANVDCGPGYQCVEQCDGGGGKDPMDPTGGAPEPGYCYPTCIQIVNEPGECYGELWCDAVPPACPSPATTPGVANGCYTGYCIPVAQCGPQDPGSCEPAACAVPAPSCPSNTTAGVKNGCWTGYCIPDAACPQVPCEAVTTEAACLGRMECTPVYTGSDCTCDPSGCTCTSQAFSRCESWLL
ncbi:MAG: hypothetical protein H0T79_17300 [Deltaproteobacteria bacterium]|nr:hypothetical protein [Deltaproteobacteria bacterium]